jgi:hypothetical protein
MFQLNSCLRTSKEVSKGVSCSSMWTDKTVRMCFVRQARQTHTALWSLSHNWTAFPHQSSHVTRRLKQSEDFCYCLTFSFAQFLRQMTSIPTTEKKSYIHRTSSGRDRKTNNKFIHFIRCSKIAFIDAIIFRDSYKYMLICIKTIYSMWKESDTSVNK